MKTFVKSLIFACIFALMGGVLVNMVFGVSPLTVAGVIVGLSFIPVPKGIAAVNIFSAPGGAGVPFSWNMTYLPQFLIWSNSVALTSLKVESQEDGVLHDWTSAGITAMANFMHVGTITAGQVVMRLADGELRRNVTISGVTSAAGVVPFRVNSERKGKLAFMSKNAAILANNPTDFQDFTALFIPTMATSTDRAEITYTSGHIQTYVMEELRELSNIYQQVNGVIINNVNAYIHNVKVTCAAATPAYVLAVKL